MQGREAFTSRKKNCQSLESGGARSWEEQLPLVKTHSQLKVALQGGGQGNEPSDLTLLLPSHSHRAPYWPNHQRAWWMSSVKVSLLGQRPAWRRVEGRPEWDWWIKLVTDMLIPWGGNQQNSEWRELSRTNYHHHLLLLLLFFSYQQINCKEGEKKEAQWGNL